jgi:uncharacterized RDD family membrane protein YckC
MATTLQAPIRKQRDRISVYLLAAPQDQAECSVIQKFLSPVIRSSKIPIEIGSDFSIQASEDTHEYKKKLYEADIVLALISADFIDDEDTYQRTQKVLARHNNNETTLIPILVRNCLWKSTPFVKLTLLPKNFQPLNNRQFWNSEDDAITQVVGDIYESIQKISNVATELPPTAVAVKSTDEDLAQPKSETRTEGIGQTAAPINVSATVAAQSQEQARAAVPIEGDWRKAYYRRVLGKRFLALLIDQAVFVLCLGIAFGVFGEPDNPELTEAESLMLGFGFVFLLFALPFMESRWRGTPGKLIMKLQITDKDGRNVSYWRAFWRNVARLAVFYIYYSVIGAVWQYFRFRKTKKLFHDEWSSTVVGERLKV